MVALEPATGRILAMVSNPTYDPNLLASHDLDAVESSWDRLIEDEPASRWSTGRSRRPIRPGSTFKLVTAAAALESGDYDPDTMVPGGAALDLPQTDNTLPNSGGGSCGGEQVTLTQALMVSCNVAFGAIGLELGEDALREKAEKFGFGQSYLHGPRRPGGQRLPRGRRRPATPPTPRSASTTSSPARCRWRW